MLLKICWQEAVAVGRRATCPILLFITGTQLGCSADSPAADAIAVQLNSTQPFIVAGTQGCKFKAMESYGRITKKFPKSANRHHRNRRYPLVSQRYPSTPNPDTPFPLTPMPALKRAMPSSRTSANTTTSSVQRCRCQPLLPTANCYCQLPLPTALDLESKCATTSPTSKNAPSG